MKTYRQRVTETCTRVVLYTVEAETPEEAEEMIEMGDTIQEVQEPMSEVLNRWPIDGLELVTDPLTKKEIRRLMDKHGQICIQCGNFISGDGGCCAGCGTDNWLEPDDFTNTLLPARWAEEQMDKILENTKGAT